MSPQQGDQRSLLSQQHRRMVPNHNWSAPRMSVIPHLLQHLLTENNGWRTWRPWRNSQYRRQDNYKLTFCWRHWLLHCKRSRFGPFNWNILLGGYIYCPFEAAVFVVASWWLSSILVHCSHLHKLLKAAVSCGCVVSGYLHELLKAAVVSGCFTGGYTFNDGYHHCRLKTIPSLSV